MIQQIWTSQKRAELAKEEYGDEQELKRPFHTSIQNGDHYDWTWHQELKAAGVVHEVIPNERLIFTFGKQAPKIIKIVNIALAQTSFV